MKKVIISALAGFTLAGSLFGSDFDQDQFYDYLKTNFNFNDNRISYEKSFFGNKEVVNEDFKFWIYNKDLTDNEKTSIEEYLRETCETSNGTYYVSNKLNGDDDEIRALFRHRHLGNGFTLSNRAQDRVSLKVFDNVNRESLQGAHNAVLYHDIDSYCVDSNDESKLLFTMNTRNFNLDRIGRPSEFNNGIWGKWSNTKKREKDKVGDKSLFKTEEDLRDTNFIDISSTSELRQRFEYIYTKTKKYERSFGLQRTPGGGE